MIIIIYIFVAVMPSGGQNKDICRGYLTDEEYLSHMIPHHQVAIDISIMLQRTSTNPNMQELLRKLIWTQNYEIFLMQYIQNNNYTQLSNDNEMNKIYINTLGDFSAPNQPGLSNTYCDPHFFNPKEHANHLKHMNITDEMYIKHMIPHHQVAVDMSKVLLKNTSNDFMIYLAYRIIRSQQHEIILLTEMLKSNTQSSPLLLNA